MASIMLIEDDASICCLYAHWLLKDGHSVRSCASVENALEALGQMALPDLFITDLLLPGADGGSFLATMLEQAPQVPVLVVTGCQDAQRLAKIRALTNVREVLGKPVDAKTLCAAVARAVAPAEGGAPASSV